MSRARRARPRAGSAEEGDGGAAVAAATIPSPSAPSQPGTPRLAGGPCLRALSARLTLMVRSMRLMGSLRVRGVRALLLAGPVPGTNIRLKGPNRNVRIYSAQPPGGGPEHVFLRSRSTSFCLMPRGDHRLGGVAREIDLCQVVQGRLGHQPRRLRLRTPAAGSPGPAGRPIEPTPGQLTDHYDPRGKVLRVSTQVADASALTTAGVTSTAHACRSPPPPSSPTRWATRCRTHGRPA